MQHLLVVAFVLICASAGAVINDADIIARGDVNHNGVVNSTDAVYLGNWLYSGGPAPPCLNEADVNHDGLVTGADQVFLLNFLFSGGPAPPSPGPYNTTCTSSGDPLVGCNAGC